LGAASIHGDFQHSCTAKESQRPTGRYILVGLVETIQAPAFRFDLERVIIDPGSEFFPGYIRDQITEGVSEENLAHPLLP